MKPVVIFMSNATNYQILPCSPEKAKSFIDKRKNKYSGEVNREVIMRFHINFVTLNSKEYNAFFLNYRADDSEYRLLANISDIEVFEDNGLKNHMGNIIDSSAPSK